MEEFRLYGVDIDMEGIDDGVSHMLVFDYLNKIKGTPISFMSLEGPTINNIENLIQGILERP